MEKKNANYKRISSKLKEMQKTVWSIDKDKKPTDIKTTIEMLQIQQLILYEWITRQQIPLLPHFFYGDTTIGWKARGDLFSLPEHLTLLEEVLDMCNKIREAIRRGEHKLVSGLKATIPAVCAHNTRTKEPAVANGEEPEWNVKVANKEKRKALASARKRADMLPDLELLEFSQSEIEDMMDKKTKKLGTGSSGKVYLSTYNGLPVALKFYKQSHKEALQELLNEIKAIKTTSGHPNIVQYIGCRVNKKPGERFVFVTEALSTTDGYTNVEDLLEALSSGERHSPLSDYERVRLALDAAKGMCWLHHSRQRPMLHRDLATKNIFVTDTSPSGRLIAKVGDFGLSYRVGIAGTSTDKGQSKGTPLTTAPEVFAGKDFSTKSDVYSFGLVLWQMWTCGDLQEAAMTALEISEETATGQNLSLVDSFANLVVHKKWRPSLKGIPRHIASIIKRMWTDNPDERPTMKDAVAMINESLVRLAIKDPLGSAFWTSQFLGMETVRWDTFKRSFYAYVGAKLPKDPKEGADLPGDVYLSVPYTGTPAERLTDSNNNSSSCGDANESGTLSALLPSPVPVTMIVEEEEKQQKEEQRDNSEAKADTAKDFAESPPVERPLASLETLSAKKKKKKDKKKDTNKKTKKTRKNSGSKNKSTGNNNAAVQTKKKGKSSKVEAPLSTTVPRDPETEAIQRLHCFMKLVAYQGDDKQYYVNIEKFGECLDYFGPIRKEQPEGVLSHMHQVLQNTWFHGHKTSTVLPMREGGTFLVRFSKEIGKFTLAVSTGTGSKPLAVRINRFGNGRFGISSEHLFDSVPDVIQWLQADSVDVTIAGKNIVLKKPCDGSPYEVIFSSSGNKYL